jgi:hypothetical protein
MSFIGHLVEVAAFDSRYSKKFFLYFCHVSAALPVLLATDNK